MRLCCHGMIQSLDFGGWLQFICCVCVFVICVWFAFVLSFSIFICDYTLPWWTFYEVNDLLLLLFQVSEIEFVPHFTLARTHNTLDKSCVVCDIAQLAPFFLLLCCCRWLTQYSLSTTWLQFAKQIPLNAFNIRFNVVRTKLSP